MRSCNKKFLEYNDIPISDIFNIGGPASLILPAFPFKLQIFKNSYVPVCVCVVSPFSFYTSV